MQWNWTYTWQLIPPLLEGLVVTIEVTALAGLLAVILGLFIAVAKRSRYRTIRVPTHWVSEFIRRTPLLVQIYFLFFVLPDVGITLSPMVAGVIALGGHSSTYLSEVYRAGIDSVPKSQWESANALNYSFFDKWTRIVLPQAIPPMIPPLGNYLLILFKDAALLSTISVLEMMGMAMAAAYDTYRFFEPFTLVGVFYLAICAPSALLLRILERRLVRNRQQ
jgi:polar amino acid transport system permease protein